MKKVYQDNFNPGTHGNPGNCWQAIIASMFELSLEDVPNFMAYGDDYWDVYINFLHKLGYTDAGQYRNPKRIGMYGDFEQFRLQVSEIKSVNGCLSAVVYSPKYATPDIILNKDAVQPFHAVLIDKEFNIIHDPNPAYKDIKEYPFADWLGVNGVIAVDVITQL